jgi:hypothetical protein
MFELLNILAVAKDYGVKLQSLDLENFTFLGTTLSGAAEIQELFYAVILEHTAIRITATTNHNRFGLRIHSFAREQAVIAVRKSIPDVEIDQFSPRQRRLYIFYGQGQSRPVHHTHMAQLVIINFYIRHCKRNDLPVGDLAPSKREKVKLCGRLPGTSVKTTKVPARPSEPEPSPPSRRSSRNKRKETQHNPLKIISGGKAVSSRTQSPVNDDTAQEEVPELRSAPWTTTSIPVAIPIAQEVDLVATPVSRRRSCRLHESTDSSSVVQSLTRSESARVWRKFSQSVMRSEQDLTRR